MSNQPSGTQTGLVCVDIVGYQYNVTLNQHGTRHEDRKVSLMHSFIILVNLKCNEVDKQLKTFDLSTYKKKNLFRSNETITFKTVVATTFLES